MTDFDLGRIFECGQCFRWNADDGGVYTGVAMGRAARVRSEDGRVYITGGAADFEDVWRRYFDLDFDYETVRRALCIDSHMELAAQFGAGIRILYQDSWEALCSFIISQCNNIPRIKKIIETLCREFGDAVELDGAVYYAFPEPSRLASLTAGDLAPLRCGYRAPYIISAARAVADGALDLDALSEGRSDDATRALKALPGIGDKVANCVALFGLHRLDVFPVDTWMKKVIKERYGGSLDPAVFGGYAGIAQQYMFFHARSGNID
ncbi:MAG: DNA-3-methyladenine glycosylase 2 family protein [Oscillospiraceae bacterium]|nr:DNA-3-methyladenine glycosylase 2 family protein [Oscillospiraceae bacterium]